MLPDCQIAVRRAHPTIFTTGDQTPTSNMDSVFAEYSIENPASIRYL